VVEHAGWAPLVRLDEPPGILARFARSMRVFLFEGTVFGALIIFMAVD
jgi:hypothetical protein